MIDKFFVVDFDRCLGSVTNSFKLITDVVTDLNIVNRDELMDARRESESKQISFSVFSYIRSERKEVDFGAIEAEYVKRAHDNPNKLRKPGASKFINYLNNKGEYYCIMSYGDPHWQAVKIAAAGFTGVPLSLIDIEHKSKIIAEWYDEKIYKFVIPAEYFIDKVSRTASEIVLIDDKQSAFDDLPVSVRGYWVENLDSPNAVWNGKMSENIRVISRIDEIIELEAKYPHS